VADSPANTAGSALRLFNRVVELTIINQPATGTDYFAREGTATIITDLRVQFEMKKNLGREPNNCTVTISNLSKDTRGRLERKPVYAILRAGHDGVLKPLFSGNISYAKSELKTPDWETKIQIADGGRAFSHARMNRSYAPPITIRQVLLDACSSMGLPFPADLANLDELNQALVGGTSAYGPARDVLTKLLAPYGYSWSVQDGRLQVLKTGLPNAKTAWLIDVDAGMLGSPEGSVPHKPGAVSELSVDVLLYPEICPGDTIEVQSRSYKGGFFRVNDLTHTGDTHGNDWSTKIKATPLGSPPPKSGRGKK
jgi:hypothetical protein